MERALSLVAAGVLTVEMAKAARGKMPLPKTFDLYTARESTRQTAFTNAAWGNASRNYAESAKGLPLAKFNAVIKEAQGHMKPGRTRKTTNVTDIINVDSMDERACIIASDSEECKSVFVCFFNLTYVILLECVAPWLLYVYIRILTNFTISLHVLHYMSGPVSMLDSTLACPT